MPIKFHSTQNLPRWCSCFRLWKTKIVPAKYFDWWLHNRTKCVTITGGTFSSHEYCEVPLCLFDTFLIAKWQGVALCSHFSATVHSWKYPCELIWLWWCWTMIVSTTFLTDHLLCLLYIKSISQPFSVEDLECFCRTRWLYLKNRICILFCCSLKLIRWLLVQFGPYGLDRTNDNLEGCGIVRVFFVTSLRKLLPFTWKIGDVFFPDVRFKTFSQWLVIGLAPFGAHLTPNKLGALRSSSDDP